jgi:hypothetical protein
MLTTVTGTNASWKSDDGTASAMGGERSLGSSPAKVAGDGSTVRRRRGRPGGSAPARVGRRPTERNTRSAMIPSSITSSAFPLPQGPRATGPERTERVRAARPERARLAREGRGEPGGRQRQGGSSNSTGGRASYRWYRASGSTERAHARRSDIPARTHHTADGPRQPR